MTDIHLNFLEPAAITRFFERLKKKSPDAVMIAGEIGEAGSVLGYLDELHSALDVPVYFVLGNHDYYHGSIQHLRSQIPEFLNTHPRLFWLTNSGVVSLSSSIALIGHDSWADGVLGDFWNSRVLLNDFVLISELANYDRSNQLRIMGELAIQAVKHFERALPEALNTHRKVFILTHVPSSRGAAWFMGKTSDENYLPFFASKVVGELLRSIMSRFPEKEATVLCGHTHGKGVYKPLPNLTVITGDARYGHPKAQGLLEV